jgi:PilZ domain
MSLLHFRCKERRRTLRVALSVPLTVHGKNDEDGKFTVNTQSQSVNRHGVLFPMEQVVAVGQHLKLVNDHTAQTVECHVVSVRRAKDGKTYVGVEFTHPENNFWHMAFPIPGERPLRRQIQTKASA